MEQETFYSAEEYLFISLGVGKFFTPKFLLIIMYAESRENLGGGGNRADYHFYICNFVLRCENCFGATCLKSPTPNLEISLLPKIIDMPQRKINQCSVQDANKRILKPHLSISF